MILARARGTGRIFATIAVVVGVVSMFAYNMLSQHEAAAAPLTQSVLCAPNICSTSESSDSFQDVTLQNALASQPSGQEWRIQDNMSAVGDADRTLLEIANQDNHFMRQVVVGVYVTPGVYNDMPARTLPLQFVTRNCNVDDDPRWSVRVRTPGDSADAALLAQYDYAASASAAQQAAAQSFCGNSDPIVFDLASQKSHFRPYAGGLLYYAEVAITLDRYNAGSPPASRNVRFQLQLTDICGIDSNCRQYVAVVKDDDSDGRNFAVSGRSPAAQVTTNSSETEYQYFSHTARPSPTQALVRQYMEFGLPCDATTSVTGAILRLYDINDGDNTGANEHGWIGGRDIVGVVLQYYDDTAGIWQPVPRPSITLTNASWAGTHNTDTISARNHFLYAVDGNASPADVIIPDSADRVETQIRFPMDPQTRYRIAITPNAARNFIAVGLPGDQISGLIDCKAVMHTPKPAAVQVWGNDLRVGGRFSGDTTDTNGSSIRARLLESSSGVAYGSWAEYGVLAPGNVVGVASGSGLGPDNRLSNDQSQWSPLTFANNAITDPRCTSATAKGCYGTSDSMGQLPDLVTAVNNNEFNGVTVQNGVCTVPATTVNAGASRIIRCNGTLEITGNIQLAAGPFTEQSLPQFIIIADRINIRNSVTRVDAWLVAQGTNGVINTCSDGPANLTFTTCDTPLVVNGPTIAKTLLLRRTANADGGTPTSAPAERFNMRSDVYIWSYQQANRSGGLTTSYVRELAPRY